MDNKILTFSADITCDAEKRTISGKIVPIGTGEVGNTSAGRVVFEAGSIKLPDDPKKIKLLNQHNVKEPLGRAQYITEAADGLYASFKVSSSTRGSDALLLASEGLQAGLSVGVSVEKSFNKAGVMHVTAADLFEVSLVTEPAFKSAQVTDVAASEEAETPADEDATTPTKESEETVENTPEVSAAPEVEAASVEAAAPKVTAMVYAQERVKPLTGAEYLSANIKAAMGDDEARRIVRAADDSTSTNTGLTLAPHLQTFITDTFTGRPAFEAVTRSALTESGMSFTVPRLYVNNATANTAPTVADTNEGSAPSETGMTSSYDTVNVNKFAGLQRVSWELIDRSSPAFMDLMMTELRKAYEKATDAALIAELTSAGTQATGVAATAAGLQSFIATESAAAYKGTGGDYANKLVASTDQWAAIMGYADSTGRALYSAATPTYNASGVAVPTSVRGNILGTDLIVDHNIATSGIVDESAFLIAPSSVYAWESPTTQLRVNVLTSGEVEIALYGYLALYVAKSGKGVRRFNYTA
jgi:HK97 family phage prohead protease